MRQISNFQAKVLLEPTALPHPTCVQTRGPKDHMNRVMRAEESVLQKDHMNIRILIV